MSADLGTAGERPGEPFFLIMGLILIAIVVSGFGASLWSKPHSIDSLPLLYHVHGTIFLAWFVLFTVQAGYVRGGLLHLHRKLGQLSFILAIAMLFTGYFMMKAAYRIPAFVIGDNSHEASMMFPVTDLVNFSIAFLLGLRQRNNAFAHKRFMLLAGILILDPAVARLVEAIGLHFLLIPALELGLLITVLAYDMHRLRRPHWATVVGVGLWLTAMAAKLVVAQQSGWNAIADFLFAKASLSANSTLEVMSLV